MRPTIAMLRHRVTIEAPLDASDDIGGFSRAYATVATVWARVETLDGDAEFAAQRLGERRRIRVVMRWRGDVASQSRLSYRDRRFLVTSVIDPDETRRFLTCLCEEIL
jgi:SPP1 family predicted phage head-tail adaptor